MKNDTLGKIESILKEELEEDYEELERPDYFAMLYAIRKIKGLISEK